MELNKIEPLRFRRSLIEAESLAITTRRDNRSQSLRSMTGLLAMTASTIVPIAIVLPIVFAIAATHPFLALFVGLAGMAAAFCGGMASAFRYIEPSDRKLLPYILEPQAKAFFLANADRRELLLERASAFDEALGAFKALPERTGVDEIDDGVVENLAERRRTLEAETEGYIEDFLQATADDRGRVAVIEKARGKPKRPDKRRLVEFKEKLGKLRDLERALDGLHGSIEKGITVDLSPFIAAQRLRGELEEERAALVARGLRPKRLPKPRTYRKFLPVITA